jgi:phthalate 4,5-cis-dihydrodiol dehydrogenase
MAKDEPISVIMVGCGRFSRYYHVPVLEADAGVTFAGIFDPMPSEEVRELARRTGATLVGAVEDLPKPTGKTMAIVTTPHALHAAHVAMALERNWHVLCDKPFVMRTSEARGLAAAAGRRGLVNAVAFNRRFDRGCLRAREVIGAGGIGAVRYIQTVQLGYEGKGWFLVPELGGGGPFTGRAAHMADIVPWLIERSPTQVRARVRGGSRERVDRGGFIDLMFGDLECQMTCVEEGWHMWDEIRIFGDDGLLELRRPLKHPIGWDLAVMTRRGDALETLTGDADPGAATRNFLDALRRRAPVACSFADAIVATGIVERAFESAHGECIWLPLAPPSS